MEIEKKKEKCLLTADSNKLLVTFLEAFKLKRQHLEESVESNDMGLRMDQDRGLNKPRKKHNIYTTSIIGDVVSKLLQDKVPQTQNLYAILIPY